SYNLLVYLLHLVLEYAGYGLYILGCTPSMLKKSSMLNYGIDWFCFRVADGSTSDQCGYGSLKNASGSTYDGVVLTRYKGLVVPMESGYRIVLDPSNGSGLFTSDDISVKGCYLVGINIAGNKASRCYMDLVCKNRSVVSKFSVQLKVISDNGCHLVGNEMESSPHIVAGLNLFFL
ncbi:hypothetical protein Tco_1075266, partial [Tanacetum coccineum]